MDNFPVWLNMLFQSRIIESEFEPGADFYSECIGFTVPCALFRLDGFGFLRHKTKLCINYYPMLSQLDMDLFHKEDFLWLMPEITPGEDLVRIPCEYPAFIENLKRISELSINLWVPPSDRY